MIPHQIAHRARRAWTFEQARAEFDYINSVDAAEMQKSFYNDLYCFARYCKMQADFIREDGFIEYADNIYKLAEFAILRELAKRAKQ